MLWVFNSIDIGQQLYKYTLDFSTSNVCLYWFRSKIIWFVWGLTFLCWSLWRFNRRATLPGHSPLRWSIFCIIYHTWAQWSAWCLNHAPLRLLEHMGLHEAVITSSFILLTFKSPQKINVLQFNDCFLKFSSIVATRYLLFPQSCRSWLAVLGFNNWWRALDQQFSLRNYAIVPPNIIYALDDFLAPVKELLHIVRRD